MCYCFSMNIKMNTSDKYGVNMIVICVVIIASCHHSYYLVSVLY